MSNRMRKLYRHDKKTNFFYHSSEWRSIRSQALQRDSYLCQVCLRKGIVKQGTTVHHLVPIKDDWSKRLDINNLETICLACHNQEHFEKGFSAEQKSKIKHAKNMGAMIFKRNPEL